VRARRFRQRDALDRVVGRKSRNFIAFTLHVSFNRCGRGSSKQCFTDGTWRSSEARLARALLCSMLRVVINPISHEA